MLHLHGAVGPRSGKGHWGHPQWRVRPHLTILVHISDGQSSFLQEKGSLHPRPRSLHLFLALDQGRGLSRSSQSFSKELSSLLKMILERPQEEGRFPHEEQCLHIGTCPGGLDCPRIGVCARITGRNRHTRLFIFYFLVVLGTTGFSVGQSNTPSAVAPAFLLTNTRALGQDAAIF